MTPHLPKLRPLNPQWVNVQGQPMLALQDPLRLADGSLMAPEPIAPLLALMDGTRDLDALRLGLELRTGIGLSPDQLKNLVGQLDEAYLLDSPLFRRALAEKLQRYRGAPYRAPAFAGEIYPADASALTAVFDDYCKDTGEPGITGDDPVVGMISPHIDYHRGWKSYARVWQPTRAAVEDAELVIILGTDHAGGPGRFTLTRQNYATPLGTLPTDTGLVERLAEVLGEDAAFEEEVHHIGEHSVELAAVWLHYMAGGRPKTILPVLCGFPEILDRGRRDRAAHRRGPGLAGGGCLAAGDAGGGRGGHQPRGAGLRRFVGFRRGGQGANQGVGRRMAGDRLLGGQGEDGGTPAAERRSHQDLRGESHTVHDGHTGRRGG